MPRELDSSAVVEKPPVDEGGCSPDGADTAINPLSFLPVTIYCINISFVLAAEANLLSIQAITTSVPPVPPFFGTVTSKWPVQ